jgi:hypothetical protein
MKSRPASVFRAFPVIAAVVVVATTAAHCEDLDAKKTAPQLFDQACSTCHHGPAGLAKGQSASGLAGFLREHYTTGPGPAGQLAAYLLANPGDGRRPRPAATNPSGPDKPEQPSTQRHPASTAETVEPTPPRSGARASRRHRGDQPGGSAASEIPAERQAVPAAEHPVGHRTRAQRAARHPAETPPAEAAPSDGLPATTRLGNRKRSPAASEKPSETRPQRPVAAEAATPSNPQSADSPTTALPPPAPPAPPPDAPVVNSAPAQADDQPAFSAPTP